MKDVKRITYPMNNLIKNKNVKMNQLLQTSSVYTHVLTPCTTIEKILPNIKLEIE